MARARLGGLLLLIACSAVPLLWGLALFRASPSDFKGIYYGARCLLQHGDPYQQGASLKVYLAEGGTPVIPSDPTLQILTRQVYLPTGFILAAPFAILPWGPSHLIWMLLSQASLTFAAFLIWDLGTDSRSGFSLFLLCFLLANSEILFASGNAAGMVVSLCVVAVWTFLRGRFVPAGIVCLALSLAIKPHDVGVVWLYFLLAGGVYRKRALQTLVVTVALCLPAILWVTHIAPHWMQELHSNLLVLEAPGNLNNPGPDSFTSHGPDMVIDLQAAISVFRDDPRIYNPASYLVCGALLLVWSIATVKSHSTPARTWLALATAAAVTMLVTYHRPYDAKILLLTIPACAMLWTEGGPARWLAPLVSTLGIVFTSDFPLAILVMLTQNVHLFSDGLAGKLLTVILIRPTPFILLVVSIFYLWIYVQRTRADTKATQVGVVLDS